MTDRELAAKYRPYLYFDKNETIPIAKIGYKLIRNSGRSPSFNRDIYIDKQKVNFAIEYQLYYDYDIQHMYDLEHVWVYVDYNGRVYDGEASQHGGQLNCFKLREMVEDETHIPVYVQPGKHAMLPDGQMFKLFGNYKEVCNELAGIDGLLVNDLFKGLIYKNSHIDYLVCNYIRENLSFEPSLEFYHAQISDEILIEWDDLFKLIPQRINRLTQNLYLFASK